MAAKGAVSKNTIFTKLKEVYSDAFWEDEGKILRIPLDEDGTRVEIKVQLTAAKTNLGGDNVSSAFDNNNEKTSKEEDSSTGTILTGKSKDISIVYLNPTDTGNQDDNTNNNP